MTLSQTNSASASAIGQEQSYLEMLYRLLDEARDRTERALTETLGIGGAGGTFQARVERDFTATEQSRRLAQLNAVEHGLCFGRTDAEPTADRPGTLYIGRIGLRDDEHEPRLIDWRAPAAHPFYAATPSDPNGLIRRRHIYTRNRTVTGVDDEVFDLDRLSEPDRRSLSGEAMLIASITSRRTGRMSDVVATIQAEQDRVIRSALQGVLVVQGGPGTGKTVAALHRAAYLLYTHRRTLERRGVLVIGPNATFLRYISQVLPSLGETDVVLSSIAELFPGVKAAPDDDPEAAVVKGDVTMVNVLRRAVRNLQQVPPDDLVITADGVAMIVPNQVVLRARDRARGRDLDPEDIPYARARLWDEPPVRAALDALWPFLTPQRLVAGLLAEEGALRRAAPGLTAAERSALLRPGHPDAWTVADVPLLDEAAQLLGTDDAADKRRRRALDRERRAEERYAREVLEITPVGNEAFGGSTRLADLVDASTLADWNRDPGQQLTTAERAWADPNWAYGHVIVDEAQELSAMAWRMVMRRIPTRSMTVVGDVAQRGSAAGARTWAQMLDPYVKGRWREELLTVNYRTPTEIMALAADVLAAVAPDERPPESVREEGAAPRAVQGLAAVPGVVKEELAEMSDGGRLAVIAPGNRIAELAQALPAAVPGDRAEVLDSPVALLTVGQAKGLEFDRVVLADPAGILDQSPAGGHDLYVAITRATHRLTGVHDGDLPASLSRLVEVPHP